MVVHVCEHLETFAASLSVGNLNTYLSGHRWGVVGNVLSECGGHRAEEGGRKVVCMCLRIRRAEMGVRPGKEEKTRQKS